MRELNKFKLLHIKDNTISFNISLNIDIEFLLYMKSYRSIEYDITKDDQERHIQEYNKISSLLNNYLIERDYECWKTTYRITGLGKKLTEEIIKYQNK